MTARLASAVGSPSRGPELTARPSPLKASPVSTARPPAGATTWTMGSPNFLANAKSRSSWAGTAMIAPVP